MAKLDQNPIIHTSETKELHTYSILIIWKGTGQELLSFIEIVNKDYPLLNSILSTQK